MSADRVLKAGYGIRSELEVGEAEQTILYEPFALRGRKLSPKEKVKKGIFLGSVAAAVGYYVFLAFLFLLR